MINEKELNLSQISPTKRDFYQIWTELLDVSKKLSERWDPTSTNETDPGIVLLKVLTACTDKLNYNIDKSILELFMPSVTQEESMRKLCDMLGYNMKYYQSATTEVTISYKGDLLNRSGVVQVLLPKFTQVKNDSENIVYTTLQDCTFSLGNQTSNSNEVVVSNKVNCMEGSYQVCSTNDGELITIDHIDDNYRYYLPEAAIAENGIFVRNLIDQSYSTEWEKVDNLNAVISGEHAWKFGFDSYRQMPYIQFPSDISSLIEDGLRIEYLRTSGVNGNISARTLNKVAFDDIDIGEGSDAITVTADDFIAVNTKASTNGANIETIDDAYSNYKKTIGTFDTLVTCRDYMNKIYNLYDEATNVPLVSNIAVSDIRDDLNRAVTLCSFNEYGISYIDKALTREENGESKDRINHFNLVLYPFKTVYGINNETEYKNSFTIDESVVPDITTAVEESKTISHIFSTIENGEIACIKNYLKLNARITTSYKVNTIEEENILKNIYTNIYKTFNMRKLDFGEDIPYDSILECIENADERIKNVSLDEPTIITKFMVKEKNGYNEYDVLAMTNASDTAKEAYNSLLLRNILAGKVKLFNYDTNFKTSFNEAKAKKPGEPEEYYNYIYGKDDKGSIVGIKSTCTLDTVAAATNPIVLTDNEVVQFRAPNYKTTITYPAYVNYFISLKSNEIQAAIPATFYILPEYVKGKQPTIKDTKNVMFEAITSTYDAEYPRFNLNEKTNEYNYDEKGTYGIKLSNTDSFAAWQAWIQAQTYTNNDKEAKLNGLYYRLSQDTTRIPGFMIDADKNKYQLCTSYIMSINPLEYYFVQKTTEDSDGLGKDAVYKNLTANEDYELTKDEYLLINYTESSSDSTTDTTVSNTVKNIYYPEGTVIRANFNLIDSLIKHNTSGASWSKTLQNGEPFKVENSIESKIEPAGFGMFTLGTNEQIEIRERAEVKLDGKRTYIYWTLNKENDDKSIPFVTVEANKKYTYTLQDGEYFYYTDQNQLDLALYGSGTEIELSFNPSSIPLKSGEASIETVANFGIDQIPWVMCNFDNENNIKLIEYQYVNLTKGDELLSTIQFESSGNKAADTKITDDFKKIANNDNVRYKISGKESSLPILTTAQDCWAARSRLELNTGASKAQQLSKNDTITLRYSNESTEIKGVNEALQTKIMTNITCLSTGGEFEIKKDLQDSFKVKVFTEADFAAQINSDKTQSLASNIANFNSYWTKISLNELTSSGKLPITVTLPDKNHYALLFAYYITNKTVDADISNTAYIEKVNNISIFNNNEAWWDKYEKAKKLHFKPGINIIKFTGDTTFTIYPDNAGNMEKNPDDILILGQIDLIANGNSDGLNLSQIPYIATTKSTAAVQLLADIKAADPNNEFYYNCLMDNSMAIDFNENLDADEQETLVSPTIWYDYNNMNNKFVISEISADDMKKGIIIARTSKR